MFETKQRTNTNANHDGLLLQDKEKNVHLLKEGATYVVIKSGRVCLRTSQEQIGYKAYEHYLVTDNKFIVN